MGLAVSEDALTIAARNLAKARGIAEQEAKAKAERHAERKASLQAYFAEHPDVEAWAEDMKAAFGEGVRVRGFGE